MNQTAFISAVSHRVRARTATSRADRECQDVSLTGSSTTHDQRRRDARRRQARPLLACSSSMVPAHRYDTIRYDTIRYINALAALAFDDWVQWGGKQGIWGPAGTGRSNAYFVASLNGGEGAVGARVSSGVARPLAPCRAATGLTCAQKLARWPA